MAENMTGMRVEGTTVASTGAKHGQGHGATDRGIGVVAAMLAALLVGSVAMHDRATSHPTVPAIPRAVTSQQRGSSRTTRPTSRMRSQRRAPRSSRASQQRFLGGEYHDAARCSRGEHGITDHDARAAAILGSEHDVA